MEYKYDKDKLIFEYLQIIQAQDKALNKLKAENKKLNNLHTTSKNNALRYRESALRWKEAYDELNQEFMESNKVVCSLVNRPVAEIERIISVYKMNQSL